MAASVRSGLCIDVPSLRINPEFSGVPYPRLESGSQTHHASIASVFPEASSAVNRPFLKTRSDALPRRPLISDVKLSLRSVRGMQGLLLAENGGALVELDPLGGGSGFKQGTRVMPELVTPRGGALADVTSPSNCYQDEQEQKPLEPADDKQRLSRHGTQLSQGVTPTRNAAELKSLPGNSTSRSKVKARTKMLPAPSKSGDKDLAERDAPSVTLERGKSHAQVEVDILLDREVFVEGSYLTGKIHVKVKKRGTKDLPMFLAGGKLRVVGFEGIPSNNERHTFYQHAAALSTISALTHVLYASPPDEEGFSRAREGVHVVPFAMKLPVSDGIHVGAKGPFDNRSGVVVKYLVIASFKLKDNTKRSIAHFYRSCDIYPFLNASIIMAPATLPLLSTTSRSLFLGGAGKLKLTASLHRNFWIAGQKCCVGIAVQNESKKTVKGLILSLTRTITMFHPRPHLDVAASNSADPDACQTTTTRKIVAETSLEAGQRGLRGHVTEKGWWTGVEPGAQMNFVHFILLPHNALSIVRSRLLEVQYGIRVSIVAGPLSSDVSVVLPVRIVNHLSIDPPPSYPTLFDQPGIHVPVPPLPIPGSDSSQRASMHDANKGTGPEEEQLASISHARDLGRSSVHQTLLAGPELRPWRMPLTDDLEPEPPNLHRRVFHGERAGLQEIREDDGEDDYHAFKDHDSVRLDRDNAGDVLGNISMDDSDEEVDFVVGSAMLEVDDQSATRFTDFHIADECEALHDLQDPTVSTVNTCPMPSGGELFAENHDELAQENPRPQAVQKKSVSVARSRLGQRPKPSDRDRDAVQLQKSKASHSIESRPNTTSVGLVLSQQSVTSAPSQRSRFSQRVDRLVATRRATSEVPVVPISNSSDRNGMPGLSVEKARTQIGASTSTHPVRLTYVPPPPLRKYMSSPSKMPVFPHMTNSVRSRIAELEGMRNTISAPDASSLSSRPKLATLDR